MGKWISGFAPIRDRSGNTIALLGIDTDAMMAKKLRVIRIAVIATIGMLSLIIMASVVVLHLLISAAAKR
jgi:hypothetical protein